MKGKEEADSSHKSQETGDGSLCSLRGSEEEREGGRGGPMPETSPWAL